MADGVDFDFSEIVHLAASLGEVPKNSGKNIRKAVEVTARRVKDDWREPLKGSPSIPTGPSTISYDLAGGEGIRGSEITAEIGPVVGQGKLGGLVGYLELGTPSLGPRGYGAAALERNQEDFQRGLEIALEQAEREAGI